MVWYITLFPWMMWERISTMGWRQWIQFALGSFSKSVTPLSTHSLLDSSLFLSLSFLWIQLSRTERYCSLAVGQSLYRSINSGYTTDLKRDFHTITNLYTHSVFWTLNQRRHSSMPRRRRRKKGRWSGDQIFTWNHQEIMSFNIQGGYYVWPRG